MKHEADVQSYPTWDSLCQFYKSPSLSHSERDEVLRLKSREPGLFFKFVRMLLSVSRLGGYTWQKFLQCSWSDIVDIIHDQATRNKEISQGSDACQNGLTPANTYLNRDHNQLPCTVDTAAKRVREALTLCDKSDPILVLGDDDMIGIELARAGFQDVTSVDIDENICKHLRIKSRELSLNLRVIRHDISLPPPQDCIRNYRLVFLDPMYSTPGIKMFIRSALEFSDFHQGTRFFLSLHLMSLLRSGFSQLPEIFDFYDVKWERFYEGFNTYPIPAGLGRWIRLFNRRFMKTRLMSSEGYMLRFFLSDAILLRKETARKLVADKHKRDQFSDE